MAGTGSGEFFGWSNLDGAETVTSFTIEPSEADTRDKEEAVIENAGCVDDAPPVGDQGWGSRGME